MAWIQVHQALKDHRKLYDAADELEITPPHMMGLLISFWLWALDNASAGQLAGVTSRMIARAAQYDGEPEKLTSALIRAGWLDKKEDGTLEIHNWYEYAGKLIDQREAEKARSKRRRTAAGKTVGEPTNDRRTTAGQPPDDQQTTAGRLDYTRVDNNIPPNPQGEGGEMKKKPLVEIRFAEFWSAYPKKVSKQYALKAWKRINPDAALHEKIMAAINAQKSSKQWLRENGRYIPNPATWLNGGNWDNEEVKTDAAEQSGAGTNYIQGFKPADDGDT